MATPSGNTSASPPTNITGNKRRGKKRIRSFTADERACHSAIEKQRREALNATFIDLARLIPALAPVHRLSKSLIVQESIHYLQAQRKMCLAAAIEIRAIHAENIELIAEVNSWRKGYGVAGTDLRQVTPVGDAVRSLLESDQEVYGTFPAGFGDNGPGEVQDDNQGVENSGRSEMDEQRDPMQPGFQPQNTSTVSNSGLNSLENSSFQHLTEPLAPDSNDISQMMRIPDGFIEANHIPTETSFPEDIHTSLDDEYGPPPASNGNILHSSHFAELNLYQDVFHDFPLSLPDINYDLPPSNEISDFGYIP